MAVRFILRQIRQPASSTSIADELAKLAKLKGEWILTAEEFE